MTDRLLAEGVAGGDEGALREFYEAHCDRLYNFIYHRVGADHPSAEDVTQETFLAALKAIHTFRGGAGLFTWLCAIARHKIADHYRRLRQRDLAALQLRVIENHSLAEAPSAEQLLVTREGIERTREALRHLPAVYQQVLTLKYIDGLPVNRIAEELERTPKSVESLLTRAREALRLRLSGSGPGAGSGDEQER